MSVYKWICDLSNYDMYLSIYETDICGSFFKHCPPSSPLQPAHVRMVAHAFSTATSVHAPLDTLDCTVKMSCVSHDRVRDVRTYVL